MSVFFLAHNMKSGKKRKKKKPLKLHYINNMDHMCISGIGPMSVILSQTEYIKRFEYDAKTTLRQNEAKRNDGINPNIQI